MSHKGKRTKAHTLYEIALLWPSDNPANIARRLNYGSVDNMLRVLNRWPEGEVWAARLGEADTLQRGYDARKHEFAEAS